MKRMIALLLALCLALCACSNSQEPEPSETESEPVVQVEGPKGSLENPYRVGETILIEEMYPEHSHHQRETPFRMKLTVTEAYTPQQGASLRDDDQLPVAEINLSFTSEYKGRMDLNQFFYRALLNENGQEEWTRLYEKDDTRQAVSSLYADEEYTLTLTATRSDMEAPLKSYPYLKLSFYSPNCNVINHIYIDLTTGHSANANTPDPTLSESELASCYEAASAAEAKGYYTVAKNYYEPILGYRDAQAHYYTVKSVLAPYNGTYYGHSHKYTDVSVWVYIQDGMVWATYDVDNTPILEYELFQQGTTADGTPAMVFSSGLTRFFKDNQNASYTEGFTLTAQDNRWIVAAEEGNADDSWNCTLEKVSNTVDVDFDR